MPIVSRASVQNKSHILIVGLQAFISCSDIEWNLVCALVQCSHTMMLIGQGYGRFCPTPPCRGGGSNPWPCTFQSNALPLDHWQKSYFCHRAAIHALKGIFNLFASYTVPLRAYVGFNLCCKQTEPWETYKVQYILCNVLYIKLQWLYRTKLDRQHWPDRVPYNT